MPAPWIRCCHFDRYSQSPQLAANDLFISSQLVGSRRTCLICPAIRHLQHCFSEQMHTGPQRGCTMQAVGRCRRQHAAAGRLPPGGRRPPAGGLVFSENPAVAGPSLSQCSAARLLTRRLIWHMFISPGMTLDPAFSSLLRCRVVWGKRCSILVSAPTCVCQMCPREYWRST